MPATFDLHPDDIGEPERPRKKERRGPCGWCKTGSATSMEMGPQIHESEAKKLLSVIEDGAATAPAGTGSGVATGVGTVADLGKMPNALAGGGNRLIKRKRQKKAENHLVEADEQPMPVVHGRGRSGRMNLDRMSPEDLMAIWDKSQSIGFARELFPELPKGYFRATRNIGHLCANLASLKKHPRNTEYSLICYEIYRKLPSWAKDIIKVKFK